MVITIANTKGGSGKSTLALNLAIKLGIGGKEVLVIDTDSQASLIKFSNIRSTKKDEDSSAYKSKFVCVHRSGVGGLSDTIKEMASKYEFLIIDTKATMNDEQKRALLLSDIALIPTTTSQIDLSELLAMFDYIKDIQVINESLRAFVVLNRINPNPFLRNEPKELKEFIQSYKIDKDLSGITIMDSILCDRVNYKRSISSGLGVAELESSDTCNVEFGAFYDEFIKRSKE